MEHRDSYDQTVQRIASEVLGVPIARLHPDQSMTDLRAADADYPLIVERSAEALGVDLAPIIESMPVYSIKAGDQTMWSLRALASVLPPAAELVSRYTVRPVDDTLGSIAASLRSGRFVDSGRRRPAVHQPMPLATFLAWLIGPLAVLLVGIPVGVAYLEHRQCCAAGAEALSDYILRRAYRADGPILFAGPFAALVVGSTVLPGLMALRADAKARRARRDL
jgi:hypothetical protein